MLSLLHEIVSGVLMCIGTFLILVAAIGLVRMPDLYLRMAASSKAATLGAACVLLALAIHFVDIGIATRSIATIVLLFLTVPIGAHMLGRAAYLTGCPLWEGTVEDELEGRYDKLTHTLHGKLPPPSAGSETGQPQASPRRWWQWWQIGSR